MKWKRAEDCCSPITCLSAAVSCQRGVYHLYRDENLSVSDRARAYHSGSPYRKRGLNNPDPMQLGEELAKQLRDELELVQAHPMSLMRNCSSLVNWDTGLLRTALGNFGWIICWTAWFLGTGTDAASD